MSKTPLYNQIDKVVLSIRFSETAPYPLSQARREKFGHWCGDVEAYTVFMPNRCIGEFETKLHKEKNIEWMDIETIPFEGKVFLIWQA